MAQVVRAIETLSALAFRPLFLVQLCTNASAGYQVSATEEQSTPQETPKATRQPRRRRRTTPKAPKAPVESAAPVSPRTVAVERPSPEGFLPSARTRFAHPSEQEFAHILDFYGVAWDYEPRSFPLRWDEDRVVEMFTPDFYLKDLGLYVELTTLKQSLVTEKNHKLRLLRELYPDINIKLLYRRDYHRLLAKYGYGPLALGQVRGIERVLLSTQQVQKRVAELGHQISQDYQGQQPVLVGVLRGVLCFMADLMREISLPVSVDFMAISYYGGDNGASVRITKDLDLPIAGKDVLLVEDIVDTGMTLRFILNYLQSRSPASLKVCTLLDKRVRRIAEAPLAYVGFEVPDEFVVGYGLDYLERYRNLPFIGILKPEEAPPSAT
ncbi:MAG: hypoxanthine phosphoribosyltransferase [Chloroflexi bacterium]|nr:hypoxanthine phosphoribosyltransferase [Chloroflexota bacterium]